jgi:hypothetical protein
MRALMRCRRLPHVWAAIGLAAEVRRAPGAAPLGS